MRPAPAFPLPAGRRDRGGSQVSLELAWTATLADALVGAGRCRRLAGFGSRGETFVHAAVAPCAARYAPLNIGEEHGLLGAVAAHTLVDDAGLFLHLDHGRNTADFDLRDATGGAVDWTAFDAGDHLPVDAPLRAALDDALPYLATAYRETAPRRT